VVTDVFGRDFTTRFSGAEVFFSIDHQKPYIGGLTAKEADAMIAFKLRGLAAWGDAKRIWNERSTPLEDQLSEIVVEVLMAGEENRRQHLVRDHQNRRWERERVAAAERRRRAEKERAAIEKLESDAALFRRATYIRALAAAARDAAGGSTAVETWAQWADSHADRIDPIVNETVFQRPELYDP
jgi:hypothetical protein